MLFFFDLITSIRLHSVRASPKANAAEANNFPLVHCSQSRANSACCEQYSPREIECSPLVNQRMSSLSFSNTRLDRFVVQRRRSHGVFLFNEFFIDWDNEGVSEGYDAWK
jgi:hypothetical protein